jgi:TonB family protein
VTALLDVAVRTSVVLVAGLSLRAAFAARSAAFRHMILAATILGAGLVIPFSLIVPSWGVTMLPAPTPAAAAAPVPVPAAPSADAGTSLRLADTARAGTAPAAPTPSAWTIAVTVTLVWALGCAAVAGVLLTGLVRLTRVAARAARIVDGPWTLAARAIGETYGLRSGVILLQTGDPSLLATWGVRPPRVLLPARAAEWPAERIRVVLCHELAHVARRDWLVQIVAQAILAALWFNPLMWIACRLLRLESEQACDDAVLARGVGAADYASHLVALARQCRRPSWSWVPALPMAHRSAFERRIAAMLNHRLDRSRLSVRSVAAAAALLLAVTLSAASLRAVQGAPAGLTGTVYDATGAVLPGVTLTLQDAQQGSAKATTDAAGKFSFPGIGSGQYVLAATLPGFRSLRQEFALTSAADWDRAVTLQVGDLQETITVSTSRVGAARPAAAPAPQRVRVGGNIRAPRKTLDVHPIYPASMRDAGREGVVPIEAVIGRDGSVTFVRVLSAQIHPDFAIAAADAVRQWQFSPTLLNGTPVEVVMTVSVSFKLSD